MPAFLYRTAFGAHSIKGLKRSIELCGVSPVRETIIGGVGEAGERTRRKWFENVAALAKYDGSRKPQTRRLPLRGLAIAGGAAVAAYLGFAALTWARYGMAAPRKGPDELLDRVMPEYEVRMNYRIEVNASPAATFDAIRETDFQRSPIVRALFRAREMLLGAKHADRPMPRAFIDQIESLGWAIIAETPGRELVLGTVTQPWQPSPTFRALPAEEFAAFHEPGYAKIAFNLCVAPTAARTCLVQTETRVQTTDPQSRGRFRRYWAALSLGMALIRIVLLQQIKTEAEFREKAEPEPASSAHEVRF